MNPYLGFLICAAVIFFSGRKLSYYGDRIATLTGLGGAWVGLILMASVTSLPELMVVGSATGLVQNADLAVGDVLGACALNLGILALMDAFVRDRKPLFGRASSAHIVSASLGLVMVCLVGLGLYLPIDLSIPPGLGLISVVLLIVYILAIRVIYSYNKSHPEEAEPGDEAAEGPALKPTIFRYALFAAFIIVAALFLPTFADEIAIETGLGHSFIGTLLLAFSTCLPEIAVSISAVRMGSINLAVGNLFGSNIFNLAILFLGDLVYTGGILLSDASEFHIVSVFGVIIMTAVAILGLMVRPQAKRMFLAADALIIFGVYVLNMIVLYRLTH
jgi:cation:H+ antiporter